MFDMNYAIGECCSPIPWFVHSVASDPLGLKNDLWKCNTPSYELWSTGHVMPFAETRNSIQTHIMTLIHMGHAIMLIFHNSMHVILNYNPMKRME